MPPMSRLGRQLQEVLVGLERASVEHDVPEARAVLLVADGGTPAGTPRAGDPFEALDDLMAVVEALCPAWPPRDGFSTMPNMLL